MNRWLVFALGALAGAAALLGASWAAVWVDEWTAEHQKVVH